MQETDYSTLLTNMFYFDKINGKQVLKSDLLNGLKHCFTTRETVIRSAETGMEEKISENKLDLCKYLEIEPENLISPVQTHSSNIAIANIGQNDYPETDAMILTNKTQAVFLNFADCTPVILFDPINNIAAIAHAGWRGTAGKIAPKTVEKMVKDFNSEPENIIAAIGPAIGECCYPIGEDVYNKLANTIENPNYCFKITKGQIFADLKEINNQQLLAVGVKKIDKCNYCTSCSNELFFSYRKENGTTSRHSAVIKLV